MTTTSLGRRCGFRAHRLPPRGVPGARFLALLLAGLSLLLWTGASAAPAGTISYVHDEAGRLVAVSEPSTGVATYEYDAVGNLLSIGRPSFSTVSVLGFAPTHGAVGTTVTIYGTSFSSTPGSNSVTFNGTAATVAAASATELEVTVPSGATTGTIAVTAPGGSDTSSTSFTVGAPPTPTISGFTPTIAVPGTSVTVTGTNFKTTALHNNVLVNTTRAVVSSASGTSISTSVPLGTTSGHLTVATPDGKAVSSGDLFVPPSPLTATDIQATGRIVSFGGSQSVTLSSGKAALVVFDGTEGQRVSVKASSVSIAASAVSLYRPDGTVLQSAAVGTSGGLVEPIVLPDTGSYTILVDPLSTFSGSMTLTLYEVPEDTTAAITAGGSAVTVSPGTPGQKANLTFNGTTDQRVFVALSSVTIGPSGTCRAQALLLRPDGSTLSSNTCISTAGGFIDTATLPSSGTYTLVVDPLGANTGSATVTLYDVPADTSTSISAGGSAVTVSPGTPGQNAKLTFTGSVDQRVSVKLSSVTIGPSGSCRTEVFLQKPDGSTLASNTCIGTAGGFMDTVVLPSAGTYTILIDPIDANTGNATVNLYDVPADTSASITPGGSAVTVSPGTPGQNAKLTFTGSVDQRISLTLTSVSIGSSGSCRTKVFLQKPDGSTLASNTCVGTSGGFLENTLPVAGTYTILVDPIDANTGSATVTLYEPTDSTTSITAGGSAVTVSPSVPGQNAKLTFTGSVDERVSVNLSSVTIGSSGVCRARALLQKPDGSTLASNTCIPTGGGFIDTTVLPTAGTYTILVDPIEGNTGSATVNLYDVPADATDTITIDGSSETLTIGTPGQNGAVTFEGSASQPVRLVLSSVSIGSSICCSARVSIKNPNGTNLAAPSSFGTFGKTVNATLGATGTHTIVIDPDDANTGSVTLTLTEPSGFAALQHAQETQERNSSALVREPMRRASPISAGESVTAATASLASNAFHSSLERVSGEKAWSGLAGLHAPEGVTALSGQVLTPNGRPLAGVTLSIGPRSTRTNKTGRFLLAPLASGHKVLVIDGQSANRGARQYGLFEVGVAIEPRRTNILPFTIWMPQTDSRNAVRIPARPRSEVVVTTPRIPGLEVHIPAGSRVVGRDGRPVRRLSITPIPVDQPPFPLPEGVEVPIYFTVQPGGARVLGPKGAYLVYPNYTDEDPGTRADFWHYRPRHDAEQHYTREGGWYIYGQGTVTRGGKQVVPDPDVRLRSFTGAMIHAGLHWFPFDDPWKAIKRLFDGDPVDLGTGLFVHEKTDLFVPDVIPLALTRTYRSNDTHARPFGPGSTHPYEMFLYSRDQWDEIALILPNGGEVHYERISGGVGFTDAVFEHKASPTEFYDSQVRWNGDGWDLLQRDGTKYMFEFIGENSLLKAIEDRSGNKVTISRLSNGRGNISQVRSPNGRWLEFSYNGNGRVSQVKDNIGRTVSYTYDGSGRLWKVTDPKGGITEYTYDGADRMLTIKDPRGIVFLTNEYDGNGRVAEQTLADTGVYEFDYTVVEGEVTQTDITDPRGFVRRVAFDAGTITSDTRAYGEPEEQTTTYEYDAESSLLESTTDPLGRVTSYSYDAAGNVTEVARLAGTPDEVVTSYDYEPEFSELASVTDPLDNTTSFDYDDEGNVVTITDARDKETTLTYNGDGQPLTVTSPLLKTTSLTYAFGDLVSVTNPASEAVTTFRDGAGRPIAQRDDLGNTWRFAHDALNRITELVDPRGAETSMTYDGNGNLLTLTDANDNVTTYTYDSMDRVEAREDPLDREEALEYDLTGNLARVADRRGSVTLYEYDALNRRTLAGFGATGTEPNVDYESTITFQYDDGNRLSEVTDSTGGLIELEYDDLDRLLSETTPQGAVAYAYDDAGRRTSMDVEDQDLIEYTYDDANRLTEIEQDTTAVALAYDDDSRRTSIELPNDVAIEYEYDDASRITGIDYEDGGTPLGDLNLAYDSSGRTTRITGSAARAGLPQAVASATYDDANQLAEWGGVTLDHDENGNIVDDGSTEYEWNARNQLVATSGVEDLTFDYDAFGRRTAKTIDSDETEYVYDQLNVVQEISGANVTDLLTGLTIDEVFRRNEPSSTTFLLPDAQGSILGLTDGTGAIQTEYTYTPYGATVASGAASGNANQFTGRENDGNGLYHYRNRYYSPTLHRFISEDPLGFVSGSPNLYSYVRNNPVDHRDPLGLCEIARDWRTAFGACAGLVAQWGAGVSAAAHQAKVHPYLGGAIATSYGQTLADLLNGGYTPAEIAQRAVTAAAVGGASATAGVVLAIPTCAGLGPLAAACIPVARFAWTTIFNMAGRKAFGL